MTVLFIGDRPSSKNLDPKIAFIGTPSHKRLLKWSAVMGFEMPYFANRIDADLEGKLAFCEQYNIPVVALGLHAQAHLVMLETPHHALPHPSGLNRKLNDKFGLELLLEDCSKWAHNYSTGRKNEDKTAV